MTHEIDPRMTFARNGKALAVSGANNSVQVINGQSLLQWTDAKVGRSADLAGLPGEKFGLGSMLWTFLIKNGEMMVFKNS